MRKYFRVMVRNSWADVWVADWQLEPVTSTLTVAPALGRATFKRRYGAGLLEDSTPLVDGSLINSYRRKYIQIRVSEVANFSTEYIWWTGIVPAEEYKIEGIDSTVVKMAGQTINAITLGYLLKTRLDTAEVRPVGAIDGRVTIDHLPVFNRKTPGGEIAGNKSSTVEFFEDVDGNYYWPYVFASGDGCGVWSYLDIIKYLLAVYQQSDPLGGPVFSLQIPPALESALDSMVGVFDLSSMTLDEALNTLMSKSRGIGWGAYVDQTNNPYIAAWSLLDSDLTIGTMTMPAHLAGDRVTFDLWNTYANGDVRVTTDATQVYDKLIVRGGRIKTCGSFMVSDSTLEKAWTADQETAYKDAAYFTTGYDALSDKEKAEKNDKFRSTDRFRQVYSSFRVPIDWDWKLGAEFANPKFDPATDILDNTQNGAYWNAPRRFYPFLPFKEGFDYSATAAVDNNPANTEPEYRKMFAVVRNADGKYVYCEQRKPAAGSVRPRTSELGIDVNFRPRHLAALNDFTGAEVSETDDEFAENACDFNDLEVTAMVETDQYLQLIETVSTNEMMRTMIIEVPGVELWYVVPDTAVDINANGDLVIYGGASNIIRDDRDTLRAILAAAVAWYGRKRNRLTVRCDDINAWTHIGQMVDDVNVEDGGSAAGTTVTEITINYGGSNKGEHMVIRTDHGEINLKAMYGAATPLLAGVPSLKVAGRKINKLEAEVAEIKKQQDKTPLRMEPTGPSSSGGDTRKAFASIDAGAGSTIECYLDTDGVGDTVTVNCSIFGGTALNEASPLLSANGKPIFVEQIGGDWWCVSPFDVVEECECTPA